MLCPCGSLQVDAAGVGTVRCRGPGSRSCGKVFSEVAYKQSVIFIALGFVTIVSAAGSRKPIYQTATGLAGFTGNQRKIETVGRVT